MKYLLLSKSDALLLYGVMVGTRVDPSGDGVLANLARRLRDETGSELEPKVAKEAEAEAGLRKMAAEIEDPLGGVLRAMFNLLDAERRRNLAALPEDLREMLTSIAMHANENPTSADRRRLGGWLGIPSHLLPRTGT